MCQCSIEFGIGPEAQPTCAAAEQVFAALRARTAANTPMKMDAAEIAVMRDLQGFHDQQRAACNRADYSRIADMVAEAVALDLARSNRARKPTEAQMA